MIRGKQGSKKASKSRKKQKERPHIRQLLVSQASQQLSGGVFKMVLAFRMQSRIRQPASGMSSEKLRYEHRLMPFFGVIAPPVISYQQFREMCDQVAAISSPPDLFAAAFQCFDDAKRILSTIPDPSEEVRPICFPALAPADPPDSPADHFLSESRQNEPSSRQTAGIWDPGFEGLLSASCDRTDADATLSLSLLPVISGV